MLIPNSVYTTGLPLSGGTISGDLVVSGLLSARTGGSDTVVVASSSASSRLRAQADYVCDGAADQVEINAAISAVGASGEVSLTEGVFNVSAPVGPFLRGQWFHGKNLGLSSADTSSTTGTRIFANAAFAGGSYVVNGSLIGDAEPLGQMRFTDFVVDANSVASVDCMRVTMYDSLLSRVLAAKGVNGFSFTGSTGSSAWNNYYTTVESCFGWSCSQDGFNFGGGNGNNTDMHFRNCFADSCGRDGFHRSPGSGTDNTYIGCEIAVSGRSAVYLDGDGSKDLFIGNLFGSSQNDGVVVDVTNGSCTMPQFIGNVFLDSGKATTNTYSALIVKASSGANLSARGLVVGNKFLNNGAPVPKYYVDLNTANAQMWSVTGNLDDNAAGTGFLHDVGTETTYDIVTGALGARLNTYKHGVTGAQFGVTGGKLGFLGASPVARPSTTGTSTGFTAGGGTTVTDASTFTGASGSTAYRISDVVKALKDLGLLAV